MYFYKDVGFFFCFHTNTGVFSLEIPSVVLLETNKQILITQSFLALILINFLILLPYFADKYAFM